MTENAEITAVLDRWAAAELAGDTAALDQLLTDDFLGIGPLGFQLPRPAYLGRHAPNGLTYDSFTLEDLQVRTYGDDTAVVVTRLVQPGSYQGNPVPEQARTTIVLVRVDGDWKLSNVQFSFVAGTPGAPPIPGPPPGKQMPTPPPGAKP
jgi:uncharacterized protein (TIGR02246 family)